MRKVAPGIVVVTLILAFSTYGVLLRAQARSYSYIGGDVTFAEICLDETGTAFLRIPQGVVGDYMVPLDAVKLTVGGYASLPPHFFGRSEPNGRVAWINIDVQKLEELRAWRRAIQERKPVILYPHE